MEEFLNLLLKLIITVLIYSLLLWGLGNLIIWLFSIDFTWSYLQSLACTLILGILKIFWNWLKG